MKKNVFGTPEQKGNVTIYPSVSVDVSKIANGNKRNGTAYVRVSTDSAEQEGSLILQKETYENSIKNNPKYELVPIYVDDGMSGTSVERRKGFLKMIEDCKAGKIDIIFTKSISRFARNTVDLLYHVNLLNSLNPPVEVRFELENISTFDMQGEMLITILGFLAQWESQMKSESITWAVDNLFAQGKFYTPPVYGYTKEKGRENPLLIKEDEAKIVRLCYALIVAGYPLIKISETLSTIEKRRIWSVNSILSLISNEKYAGNLRARKTITPNYKTHKTKKNEGEKPQYFVKGHHEAIVPLLAYETALKIVKSKKSNSNGIPYLKAVPKGIFKGFVLIDKTIKGHTLNDYIGASKMVGENKNNAETKFFADQISVFDFQNFTTVSALLFDDDLKPACTIKLGKIIFNSACFKAIQKENVEILFHPVKAILAIRTSINENKNQNFMITKPVHLSTFLPIALQSVDIKPDNHYRMYGTKREKNGERVLFFDLNNVEIISKNKNEYILPNKYINSYGEEYYENLITCDLHKIDIGGLWQALQESKPADSLEGQIIELAEFCKENLTEFNLLEK